MFKWHPAANTTKYQLDVSTSDAFPIFSFTDSSLADTTKPVSGLSLNTAYYWRARAKNGAGWGQYSLTRQLVTWNVSDQILLDAPSDLSVNVPVPTTFTWHPMPAASAYRIDLSRSNNFSILAFSDSTGTDTSETFPNLALNTAYFWRVRGKNDAGSGQFSETRTITTWDVPGQVQLLLPPNDVLRVVNSFSAVQHQAILNDDTLSARTAQLPLQTGNRDP